MNTLWIKMSLKTWQNPPQVWQALERKKPKWSDKVTNQLGPGPSSEDKNYKNRLWNDGILCQDSCWLHSECGVILYDITWFFTFSLTSAWAWSKVSSSTNESWPEKVCVMTLNSFTSIPGWGMSAAKQRNSIRNVAKASAPTAVW